MTKASRDTERGRGRRKEEEREGRRQVFPATNNRPGTHQEESGVPEFAPKKAKKEEGG